MSKVAQEFYCNDCDGYVRLKLNMALNQRVRVVCPNCGHQHPRELRDGVIYECYHSADAETICPPKSSYSKTSLLAPKHSREGVRIDDQTSPELRLLWFERFGTRV